jgi:hypothetical protein
LVLREGVGARVLSSDVGAIIEGDTENDTRERDETNA